MTAAALAAMALDFTLGLTAFAAFLVVALYIHLVMHEVGHYVAARAVGADIVEFRVLTGPITAQWRRGGVTYTIRRYPLSGHVHVRMAPEVIPCLAVVTAGCAVNLAIAVTALIVWFNVDPFDTPGLFAYALFAVGATILFSQWNGGDGSDRAVARTIITEWRANTATPRLDGELPSDD